MPVIRFVAARENPSRTENEAMHFTKTILSCLTILALVGCAHPINVEPDFTKVISTTASPLPLRVGYHVPPDLMNIEVTTTGGGGDNVRYQPYAAITTGYQRMLGTVFQSVTPLATWPVSPSAAAPAVDYVLTPSIVTSSGGSNFFTWPPETFSVDLSTKILDKSGKTVATPRVVGVGTASTSERLADHGASGRRAFEDALRKMASALRAWGTEQQPSAKRADETGATPERLRQLKDLFDRKLISEQEYESKRKAILADL
jgi:hypothetical protein